MATLSAWLSVLVKRGQEVIKPRTVVKCCWEDTFGSLLDKLDMTQVSIELSANEKFTDPVHVVPIDAPVIICDQFKCMHVCVTIESMERIHAPERRPNAFDVLMASSRDVVLPPKLSPPDGKELRKDQQLYNNLLGIFVLLCALSLLSHSLSVSPFDSIYLYLQVNLALWVLGGGLAARIQVPTSSANLLTLCGTWTPTMTSFRNEAYTYPSGS